jgi:glycosyltransferase involved in cell wall biosynthesis
MTVDAISSGAQRFDCTIAIPTLALSERSSMLDRAIASIRRGNRSTIDVVVVVNGDRFDAGVVEALRCRPDLRVLQITTPSLSAALHAGRIAVRAPYFGFLDDDDEYLPGTVDARLSALAVDQSASVVVTNGYRYIDGSDRAAMFHLRPMPADPLRALFRENWLASCGGMFRADRISSSLFTDIAHYLEWTWLAFRIACERHQVVALDMPGFRIHDTVGSESKSEAYLVSQPGIYTRMLRASPPHDIARILRSRRTQAWHDISVHHLRNKNYKRAWHAHLKSINHPSGWKFMLYTRRLMSLSTLWRRG